MRYPSKCCFFVIFFLLTDSSASEFYVSTFRDTPFRLRKSLFTTPMKMNQAQRRMKMEQTDCSKTSARKYQTPGNHPKERIQPSQHDESKKSRKDIFSAINANMANVRKFRVMYDRSKVL